MMAFIDESLPLDPKLAEAVLFVRTVLRRSIHLKEATTADIGLLFGLTGLESRELGLGEVLDSEVPVLRAAERIASVKGDPDGPVPLIGNTPDAAERCREWLSTRHQTAPEFSRRIAAFDLMTLLAMERARTWIGSERALLVEGPTGTGKELVARALHERALALGTIKQDRYEVVHVAGMREEHISDELFGHVRGAFTGADKERTGRFEAANGGTLLIDEVGDLSPETQLQLLRVLQERKFSKLGENKLIDVRVQVIVATQHDLDARVKEGRFREDLLQRLRGFHVRLPPLADRRERFDELVAEVIVRAGGNSRRPMTISALDALSSYPWPGNLRELRTKIDVALHASGNQTVTIDHLPLDVQRAFLESPVAVRARGLLGDETDDSPITERVAAHRVRAVENELARQPRPEVKGVVDVQLEMLEGIPENSKTHDAKKNALKQFKESTKEVKALEASVELWKSLSEQYRSHPRLREPTDEAYRRARQALDSANEMLSKARDLNEAITSGWTRLFEEFAQNPLFRGAQGQHVIPIANVVRMIGGTLVTFAPDLASDLRQAAENSGFAGFRKRLARAMSDEAPRKADPKAMEKADWEELARLSSLSEAAEKTGLDPRTIKNGFARNKIPNPWER